MYGLSPRELNKHSSFGVAKGHDIAQVCSYLIQNKSSKV